MNELSEMQNRSACSKWQYNISNGNNGSNGDNGLIGDTGNNYSNGDSGNIGDDDDL